MQTQLVMPAKDPADLNDTEFLEAVLREGPATTNEILRRSFRARGVGLTVHSRAADLRVRLRPKGETVACRSLGLNARGRQEWEYAITEAR